MMGEPTCWSENLVMATLHWGKVVQSPLDKSCDSSEQSTLCAKHSDMEQTPQVTQEISCVSAFGEHLKALLSEHTFLLYG